MSWTYRLPLPSSSDRGRNRRAWATRITLAEWNTPDIIDKLTVVAEPVVNAVKIETSFTWLCPERRHRGDRDLVQQGLAPQAAGRRVDGHGRSWRPFQGWDWRLEEQGRKTGGRSSTTPARTRIRRSRRMDVTRPSTRTYRPGVRCGHRRRPGNLTLTTAKLSDSEPGAIPEAERLRAGAIPRSRRGEERKGPMQGPEDLLTPRERRRSSVSVRRRSPVGREGRLTLLRT